VALHAVVAGGVVVVAGATATAGSVALGLDVVVGGHGVSVGTTGNQSRAFEVV